MSSTQYSLPVLLTGTGSLGAVHYLRHCDQAAGTISQATIAMGPRAQHPGAVCSVPGVVAVGPRQEVCHGHEEVVEGDADNHIVIDADVGGHHHHAVAHT